MASTFLPFNPQPMASSSGAKPKRKRASSLEAEESNAKHLRIVAPQFDTATGFGFPPELIPDMTTSTTASESDQMMDHDMDFDMDETLETPYAAPETNYSYAEGGSGGFGFGPGAEEDDMDSDDSPKSGYAQLGVYPSTTTHPNPHHFSNSPPFTSFQQNSGWNTNPSNAAGAAPGLIQPASAGPLPWGANAVERARNAHGPQCTSIPKLHMSDYPDSTGSRSLWSICQDCGACERAS